MPKLVDNLLVMCWGDFGAEKCFGESREEFRLVKPHTTKSKFHILCSASKTPFFTIHELQLRTLATKQIVANPALLGFFNLLTLVALIHLRRCGRDVRHPCCE